MVRRISVSIKPPEPPKPITCFGCAYHLSSTSKTAQGAVVVHQRCALKGLLLQGPTIPPACNEYRINNDYHNIKTEKKRRSCYDCVWRRDGVRTEFSLTGDIPVRTDIPISYCSNRHLNNRVLDNDRYAISCTGFKRKE